MAGVVLLHGLFGFRLQLRPIEKALRASGFAVCNLGYRSTRHSLETIAENIAPLVAEFGARQDAVHFITHSMGGLVARILLARRRPDNLGRVVMLAPPNAGSEIVDVLSRNRVSRRALGPAAAQLATRRDRAFEQLLGTVDFELGIIAGDRPFDPLGAALLPRPNDGRVSVTSTRDPRAADHLVLPVAHSEVLWNRQAIRQSLRFLQTGRFDMVAAPE